MKVKPIEELTFTDDFMFGRIMQNPEICKGLLERLLEIKIDKIEYPILQKTIAPHYKAKGIRLDVYVQDSNRVFDIEIQNVIDINLPKRIRYYQSIMDVDLLLKGNDYTELKESFIIFVCKDDFFGHNLPCYTFENTCKEKNILNLNDMTHKIIFNASAFANESNIEKKSILEYIKNKNSTSDFTLQIDNLVEQTKSNEFFREEYMIKSLFEVDAEKRGFKEGEKDGFEKGSKQKETEIVKNMILKNIPLDVISECTNLSLESVEKLAKEISSE